MSFDSIRSYNQDEIIVALERLTQDKQFMNLLSTIYPLIPKDVLKERILQIKNVQEFQKTLISPFLQYLEDTVTKGVNLEGFTNIEEDKSYLYISNHRDIILDATLLCFKLLQNGFDSTEVAIGDNLLIYPWIEDLVRVNKSFIVRRSLTAKQMLEGSKLMSAYIAHTINSRNQSIWIAQREGRAKDADDRTQESLLKMLNMGGEYETFAENLAALHINPLSISYEYDPCDYLKAKEFQQKRDNPEYKKSPADDLLNMKVGVMGFKGRVEYRITGEISNEIMDLVPSAQNRNELVSAIAALIDSRIHANYTIYKINKIAFDLLNEKPIYHKEYSLMDKLNFEKYLEQQIAKIDLAHKDIDFLKSKILEMYANPLKNHRIAHGKA